jgi:DNA-binding transcriptional LysR family regulator
MRFSDQIERRMKLHDLHVLTTVTQFGSMAAAARQLNTSQPAISRSIAELEKTLGVRLFDRNRRGIEPTDYGLALLDCSLAVFDELRQGVKRIEFLINPTAGEIRIGGNEPQIDGLLPTVIAQLHRKYPGFSHHVTPIDNLAQQYANLRERTVDLILARIPQSVDEDVTSEVLFHDRTFVVAGSRNKWTRRRKVELTELADGPWCLPPVGSLPGSIFAQAFRAGGIEFPPKGVTTGSPNMHLALLAGGPFLAILPGSMLRFSRNLRSVKILPVNLEIPPWPVGFMTLKGRTLNPATNLFIECTRDVVRPLAKEARRI